MTIISVMGKDCGHVYYPPHLPTGEVSAVAYDTLQEAEAHNAALATEAARAKPGDQDA